MKLIINTDGGARGNPGPAGIGVVFADESGKLLNEFKEYIGEATNNVAEYKALLLALERASQMPQKSSQDIELDIRMDSELIVKQMQGKYKIKEPTLQMLATQVLKLKNNFKNVKFTHVRRGFNKQADSLVNQAIDAHVK